eukprot:gene14986-16532_t
MDKKLVGGLLASLNVPSLMFCANKCTSSQNCQTFNFKPHDLSATASEQINCQLLSMTKESSGATLTTSTGRVHVVALYNVRLALSVLNLARNTLDTNVLASPNATPILVSTELFVPMASTNIPAPVQQGSPEHNAKQSCRCSWLTGSTVLDLSKYKQLEERLFPAA